MPKGGTVYESLTHSLTHSPTHGHLICNVPSNENDHFQLRAFADDTYRLPIATSTQGTDQQNSAGQRWYLTLLPDNVYDYITQYRTFNPEIPIEATLLYTFYNHAHRLSS